MFRTSAAIHASNHARTGRAALPRTEARRSQRLQQRGMVCRRGRTSLRCWFVKLTIFVGFWCLFNLSDPEFAQWIPGLVHHLIPCLLHAKAPRSLHENAAVTLGRIGLIQPAMLAPQLEVFAEQWHASFPLYFSVSNG
jgi:uncharacterized membrane protein